MANVFTVGDDVVRIVGVVWSKSLNGAIGKIVGDVDSESNGKYGIKLQSPAAAVASNPSGISKSHEIRSMCWRRL
jgi:hypothetical protein